MESVYAVIKEPTPIHRAHNRIIGLRPMTSAFDASNIAPKAMPNNPALKTIPKLDGFIFHADAMELAVYEITITFMPSHIFIKKQIKITP